MIALRGYYDGRCVQLLEPAEVKKNQKVIVTVMDDFFKEDAEREDHRQAMRDAFTQALRQDRFVIPTGLNADEYVMELREDDRI